MDKPCTVGIYIADAVPTTIKNKIKDKIQEDRVNSKNSQENYLFFNHKKSIKNDIFVTF